VLSAGARLLEEMLVGIGSGRCAEPLLCHCGQKMESRGRKTKRIKTVLGDIEYRRSLFACPACNATCCPGDEALDIAGTGFSPGVRRMMSRAGSRATFKEARDDLKDYAEIVVTSKDVERTAEDVGEEVESWQKNQRAELISHPFPSPVSKDIPLMYVCYDGTGVPMVPWETIGRKGKQPDGSSRSREVKLGCVFTQTTVDDNGRPVRDDMSTTFVGAIEDSDQFGGRIYGESLRRGLERAKKTVVLGDGARWIWDIAEMHFPGATQIVDLYHAREHVYELCSILAGSDETSRIRNQIKWLTALDEGNPEKIGEDTMKLLPRRGERRKAALREIGYFKNNAHRMRYEQFRKEGLFVGSGVVEAGCKSIVGLRLKRSGMEWTVRGANSIIALRCGYLSGRMEDFWEQRAG